MQAGPGNLSSSPYGLDVMGRVRPSGAIVAAVLVAISVAACAGSGPGVSSAVVTYTHGGPPAVIARVVSNATATAPFAVWAGPREIYVVAWGSGSCPHLPTTVYADRHNDVIVKTEEQSFGANACTADLGPTTSTVKLPTGVDLTKRLRVEIDGIATTLDPR
jgi:hypothetical protein